jgi:translocation and assembly module TamB
MATLHMGEPNPGTPRGPHRQRKQNLYLRAAAWFAVCSAFIAILCVAAVSFLVNTERGHRYLIGLAQQKAGDALGVQVQLQNFALHLSTLTLDLYGIRIAGAAPHANPPLLQANHLKVGVRVVSVLNRKWYLDRIQIDHPVAWVVVDKNGVSNLPVFKSSGSSHTDLFDLGIRHVQIERGEVYYNSRSHALTADLHDLDFRSVFSSELKSYSGSIGYSDGNLTFGSFKPLKHNLEAEFVATPTTFTLKQGTVTAGPSRATLSATVENYSNPSVNAHYEIILDGRQAGQILNEPSVPAGVVQTSGTLQYQQSANQSVVASLIINGTLASAGLSLKTSTARAGVADISARYSLAHGNATLESLHAKLLGGELAADGTMQDIGDNTHSKLRLDLQKVSLAALQQDFGNSASAKTVSLHGTADASATATWGKTIDDLVAHADLALEGNATRPQAKSPGVTRASITANASPGQPAIPIQAAIHAIYSNASRSLAVNNSNLKSSQSTLLLNGTIGRWSSLAVNLQANDLSEIATLVDAFRTPAANAPALNLQGQASFHGTIRGSTTSPYLAGQLSATNLEYNGSKWKRLTTGVELNPSHAGLTNLRLEVTDHGQIMGNAGVELHDWSFSRDSAMQADLTVSGMPAATLTELAGQSIPVTGTINANAHVHGTVMAPTGDARLRLTGATAFGESIRVAAIDAAGSSNNVRATASVQLPAGTVQAQVITNPLARTYNVQLNSSGVDLEKLQAIKARGIDANGVLRIHVQGQGSYDDPALDADLEIPTLTMNGQTISNTRLQVNEAHRVADVELASTVLNAPVRAKAQVNLQGDYRIDGSLDTPAIPIETLLAAYAPTADANITGQVEVHAAIQGPLKNKNLLQAHIRLPVLKVAYGNAIQLQASPIQADYQEGLVRLQPVTIRGTDTELNLQGAFPVAGRAPATLQVHGSVNMQIAQIFDPDLRTSGELKINVDSQGTTANNLLAGEIDIADAGVSTTDSPVSLQNANGVLKLTSDRLTVAKFNGTMSGGGEVTAVGAVIYRPHIQFDLGLAMKGARILYPQGVRENVDANLRLTGTTSSARLGGAVNLSNVSFTPAFDLSSIVNQLSGGVETPATGGFAQNLQLNIALNSTNNVNLVGRTLSVNGSANLQIRGTAAQPVVLGRVNLTGGDAILNGNRFVLTGGTVQFINPAMTEPVLNVSLTTTIQEYKIDLRFRGPADQMRTQYTSDPSLPPADIIHLLAFGQTTEASAANTTPMNQQAESLVASQVSSQVTSRISKAAGISQLSISPVLANGTSEGPPGANLTIQQRVTGNLFVTFSTNVATTQGQTIQGQYQVSPRVSLSATRDPNGGFALDTLIKKSW